MDLAQALCVYYDKNYLTSALSSSVSIFQVGGMGPRSLEMLKMVWP